MSPSGTDLQFEVIYPSRAEAEAVRADVRKHGATAELEQRPGLLPLAVLLAVTIPPGAALLINVIDRVIHGWKGHGIVIDARGTGAVQIKGDPNVPYGSVITLTRDKDQAARTDLPDQKIGDYVSGVLTALAKGVSATAADKQAGV